MAQVVKSPSIQSVQEEVGGGDKSSTSAISGLESLPSWSISKGDFHLPFCKYTLAWLPF